jgi:hypothetical protein
LPAAATVAVTHALTVLVAGAVTFAIRLVGLVRARTFRFGNASAVERCPEPASAVDAAAPVHPHAISRRVSAGLAVGVRGTAPPGLPRGSGDGSPGLPRGSGGTAPPG